MPNETQAVAGKGDAATTNGVANAFLDADDPSIEIPGSEEEGRDERRPVIDTAAEDEARSSGWVTEAEWKEQHNGSLKGWKPASEFNEFRSAMLPLVSKENKALRAELAAIKEKFAAQEAEQAKAALVLRKETLRQQLRTARDSGDADAEDRIMDEMLDLKTSEKAKPAPQNNGIDPEVAKSVQQFGERNPWLKTNPVLMKNFTVELKAIKDAGAADNIGDMLEIAKERVKRMYPEQFSRRTSMAETDGEDRAASSRPGTFRWSDLKAEYKDAYDDKYFRDNPLVKKENLLKRFAQSPKDYFKGA